MSTDFRSPGAGPAARPPSSAFVGASWVALLIGVVAFGIGLWNVRLPPGDKGFFLTVLLFGLFAAVSVQKSVRDRVEGVPVTALYYGLSWVATLAAIVLLTVGLWNVDLRLSEKGFFGMSFTLSLFSAVAVQKNVRDLAAGGTDPGDGPGGSPEPRPWVVPPPQ